MATGGAGGVGAAGGVPDEGKEGRYKYQPELQAMMYTFGDVRDPLPATTELVEDIVRLHVSKLAGEAYAAALRRGSRQTSPEDVMFVFRHDAEQLGRIANYMSWSNVRKNVKQSTGGGPPDDAGDLFDDDDKLKQPTRKRIKLTFDLLPSLVEGLRDMDELVDAAHMTQHGQAAHAAHLRELDEATRFMSPDEYMEYTECRQASFTNKKAKRFREWLELGSFMEMKPSDDALDMLGFLAWQLTRTLTRTALDVQRDMNKASERERARAGLPKLTGRPSLFRGATTKAPLEPEHILEAHRRLQASSRHSHVFRPSRTLTAIRP